MTSAATTSSLGGGLSSRLSGLVTFVAVTLMLSGGVWVALSTVINHDSAWYLHATKVFLEGGRLYQDIVEINPPLAFYLTVPPVWFAQATESFAVDVFFIWIFVLTALSLGLSWVAMRGLPGLTPGWRGAIIVAACLVMILAPWRELGQREHLLMIFAVPYFFLVASRAADGVCGRGLAIAVGLFGAFGFALKPYFLLLPLAAEAYLLIAHRSVRRLIRAETLVLAAALVLYAISVLVFTPAYFTHVLPLALAVYGAYAAPFIAVFFQPETVLLLGVLLVRGGAPREGSFGKLIDVFLVAAFASYVAYLIQMKAWPYQRIPVSASLLMVLALSVLACLRRGLAVRPRYGPFLILLLFGGATAWLVERGSYRNDFLAPALSVARTVTPGDGIFVFTTNVSHAFPLVTYAGADWPSRFSTLWTLPGVVRRRAALGSDIDPQERTRLEEIERYTFDAVMESLARRPPALIFVDNRVQKPYFGGETYDYLAHFTTDPRFAALWSYYEKEADLGAYRVYRRRDERLPQ